MLVGLPGGCVDVEGSDVVGGTPVAGRYTSMSCGQGEVNYTNVTMNRCSALGG